MPRRHLRTRILALATLITAAVSGLALAPSAHAAPVEATGGTLSWAVSTYVGTSSSLTPERLAGAPATVDADGWDFTDGDGYYDPDTGETIVELSGAIEFGNVNQGNYGFRLADPVIVIDADGSGRLEADVATRGPGAPGPKSTFGTPVAGVTVVTFTAGAGTEDDGTVTWTVTPDTEDVPTSPAFVGAQQFPQSFLSAFSPALAGHFRQTSAAGAAEPANIDKLPAPLTFTLDYEAPDEPTEPEPDPEVTVTPTSDLDPAGDTLTISGTGFTKAAGDTNENALGVYVRFCAAVDGEVGTSAGRPGTADCLGSPQHWVGATAPPSTATMAGDGSFSVTLEVPSTFTAGSAIDCTEVSCGIAVRRDHNGGGGDFSYDSFTPVTFAEGDGPTDPTDPTEPEPPAPTPGEGSLDWGLKASFRNYIINGPAAGTIETVAPATINADGTYRFDAADGGSYGGPGEVDAPFEGAVHFSGHEGQLDLVITDPRVAIDGEVGTLTVDASSKGLETGRTEVFDDVVFASLDLDDVDPTAIGNDVTFADIPATLTADGAEAFAGFYAAGDALDPVTFVIAVDDPGNLPAPTPPAEEVAGCVLPSVPAGGSTPVCGDGFLPGEQVQVFLHSDPVLLTVVTADDAGAVRADVVIPAETAPGTHRLELRGVSGGRSLFSAEFTVTAAVGAAALPRTGGDTGDQVVLALGLVALGGLLVAAGRRRLRPAT